MALPVVLCIGSASVKGDSLGPVVGDILREKYNVRAFVYGGLKSPVNGVNYCDYVKFIAKRHPASFIIAVDASVGAQKDMCKIKYAAGGVAAGGALNKKLERVGDLGILGVVAVKDEDNLSALLSVPEERVDIMAKRIALRITEILEKLSALTSYDIKNTQTTQLNHVKSCYSP